MKGLTAFARKEVMEILRTWRIWVLPGILLFFALGGPAMAKYTPQIVAAAAGSQLKGFTLPPPGYQDSYSQWIKNLSQIGLFALIIIYGGIVFSERKSGTAILVLTKPLSRSAFVIAKALVHMAFLAAVVLAGTLSTWGGTALFFGEAPAGALFASAGAWLVFGLLFLALMTLLSVTINSQAGAAGLGLGAYALVSLAAIWEPLRTYSPAALVGGPATLASGGSFEAFWPIASSALLAALLVALAALAFSRKEL
jgi:ABC-2 type transport system permease protein